MKREIKFRAKELKNCRWRYGNLHIVERGSQCHIVGFGNIYPIEEKDTTIQYGGVLNWWEVEPESVCQFTGLKDKNGVEIYEGDIVEFTRAQCRGAYRGSRMAVSYQTYVFCGFGFDKTMALTKKRANECNIIGNIFDNPELLK